MSSMGGMGGMGGSGGMGGMEHMMSGGSGRARSRSRERRLRGEPPPTADSLGLDQKAKVALAELSEWQQQAVLREINPQACRDPTAVAMTKIREIKSSGGMGAMGTGSMG